jgi:hypothetical protein
MSEVLPKRLDKITGRAKSSDQRKEKDLSKEKEKNRVDKRDVDKRSEATSRHSLTLPILRWAV